MQRTYKSSLVSSVIVLIVIIVAAFYLYAHHKSKSSVSSSAGNSDSSLDADLSTINTGLDQAHQNLQGGDKALADQQLPVMQ